MECTNKKAKSFTTGGHHMTCVNADFIVSVDHKVVSVGSPPCVTNNLGLILFLGRCIEWVGFEGARVCLVLLLNTLFNRMLIFKTKQGVCGHNPALPLTLTITPDPVGECPLDGSWHTPTVACQRHRMRGRGGSNDRMSMCRRECVNFRV